MVVSGEMTLQEVKSKETTRWAVSERGDAAGVKSRLDCDQKYGRAVAAASSESRMRKKAAWK